MSEATKCVGACKGDTATQAEFVGLLPVIGRVAGAAFKGRGAEAQEEGVAEAVALAWRSYVRLRTKGMDPRTFPVKLARFATRQAAAGQRLGRGRATGDVYSVRRAGRLVRDAECVGRTVPVPERVALSLDLEAWLEGLPGPTRDAVGMLASGMLPSTVAGAFRIPVDRVAEFRRELRRDWESFRGE